MKRLALALLALGWSALSAAASFVAPPADVGVVGTLRTVRAVPGESLVDLARRRHLGQDALRRANPELPRWLPLGEAAVRLPTRHVLPAAPREGIVVNLPERRLYHYHRSAGGEARVAVHPVSIGRVAWATPLGEARVVARREDPPWRPPASIREEAARAGRELPAVVPAGPDNPLGRHALYLDRPGYLLHGTNAPDAIGLRVTHGCIRLYPRDIAGLYRRVALGTSVRIVDEPLKVGWHAGSLYLEVHPPLEEGGVLDDGADPTETLIDRAFERLAAARGGPRSPAVSSYLVRRAVERRDGLPVAVGGAALASPR